MMRLLALASFLAVCLAAPSPRASHHVVHETRAADPIDWQIARRLEHDKVLPMRFGLRQENLHRIEEMLLAVSHPQSPTYGQHWTPSTVVETFAPSDDTIAAVANWLTDAGITRERLRLSVSKGWIDLNATVGEMEDLLKTEYHVYSHEETGDEQIGCVSYSVPAHVQPHVDLIKPTVHFRHRPVSNRFNKR
ncbi:Aorsin, partial [Termitomyces sp. T112]